jgi:dTDP-4-dehydrorhamnose 3,5-epimerase
VQSQNSSMMSNNDKWLLPTFFEVPRFEDSRGHFSKHYPFVNDESFEFQIKQINRSANIKRGTIRGMHYQAAPWCEGKIVTCLSGSVLDVIVNIQLESPDFLKTFEYELSESESKALYVPHGYAHGYQTLTDNTELLYLHDSDFVPKAQQGINPFDPLIALNWPLEVTNISNSDLERPSLGHDFRGFKCTHADIVEQN